MKCGGFYPCHGLLPLHVHVGPSHGQMEHWALEPNHVRSNYQHKWLRQYLNYNSPVSGLTAGSCYPKTAHDKGKALLNSSIRIKSEPSNALFGP